MAFWDGLACLFLKISKKKVKYIFFGFLFFLQAEAGQPTFGLSTCLFLIFYNFFLGFRRASPLIHRQGGMYLWSSFSKTGGADLPALSSLNQIVPSLLCHPIFNTESIQHMWDYWYDTELGHLDIMHIVKKFLKARQVTPDAAHV